MKIYDLIKFILFSCVHGLYFINIYNLLFLTKE